MPHASTRFGRHRAGLPPILVLAAMALVATAPAAVARPGLDGSHGVPADPPEGFQPGLSAATGTLCVKQCPSDDLPCDPPAFKVADGRCTTAWH